MRRLLTPLGVSLFGFFGLALFSASLLTAASIRYGGPEELYMRLRQKIAVREEHPDFVPTPLSAAVSVEPEAAVLLPNELPQQSIGDLTMVGSASAQANSQADKTAAGPPLSRYVEPQAEPGPPGLAAPSEAPARPAAADVDLAAEPIVVPTVQPAPSFLPAAALAEVTGIRHAWQTWNNCGPATLSMNLSYFGSKLSQADIGKILKGNRDDKNVSPDELAEYARAQGFRALVRHNGSLNRMRLLLANGLPVLVETWLEDEPNNGMGHYRLLTAYDDAKDEWRAFDSYVSKGIDPNNYRGIRFSNDELDGLWAVFNRAYVLIYADEYEPKVAAILGTDYDEQGMWQRALDEGQAATQARPNDAFAWFNLGSDLTALGRYEEAVAAFDRARVIKLPWRMLWYQFAPFKAYFETGRYDELLALADATIRTKGNVEEIYFWRGKALAAQSDVNGARQAWQRAVELNPRYGDALTALKQG